MPNTLMTRDEVDAEIIAPYLEALADDIEKRPVTGEFRDYRNPLGSDMLPVRIERQANPSATAKALRKLAAELRAKVAPKT